VKTATVSSSFLLVPSVAISWLLATVAFDRLRRKTFTGLATGAAIVVVYLGLIAVLTVRWTGDFRSLARSIWRIGVDMEAPSASEAASARLLLLDAPRWATSSVPVCRLAAGLPPPAAIWQLSLVSGEHQLTSTGPTSFSLEVPAPGILHSAKEFLWRDHGLVREGEQFERGALRVEVSQVEEGTVRRIDVGIDRPVDDPTVWLLSWRGDRYERVSPPPPGGTIVPGR
jgi:hypothetical protein